MIPAINERKRFAAPTVTPQALAWHDGKLWMGSRDLRRIYQIDPQSWTVLEEIEPPGIPWAAVSSGDALYFTLGVGANDDRYIRRFTPGAGFEEGEGIACPDFTGSYLSFDGEHLYLSQWYKGRILQLDRGGNVTRTIDVGQEISGHTFANGLLYVLRGTEEDGEHWRVARLDPHDATTVHEIATVPFACRSLTYDGQNFWSNYRAGNATICFALPA
ncbi:MAG TPA: hypothetical protein VGC85_06310 [Chthoniobacterales bacterium]